MAGRGTLVLMLLASLACSKVPIFDVEAGFVLADAAWFEEEETLFIFYHVQAAQGLGPKSVVELRYTTDDLVQPWARVADLPAVHRHVAVDCGYNAVCGSTSLHVVRPPRGVGVRLRYHADGDMALDAPVRLNLVGRGAPWSHRSMLVYGVLDADNGFVQWRGRHQFPTVRNEQAQALGLRRRFVIEEQRYRSLPEEALAPGVAQADPYLYGLAADCPSDFVPAGIASPLETTERAFFNPEPLPLAAAPAAVVCARATVYDARGPFAVAAMARKNPEVHPAFPALSTPIAENTPIRFLLAPCHRTISAEHEAMQKQRLLIEGGVDICLDDWEAAGFADAVAARLRERIDQVRAAGSDMVLVIALHHDDTSGRLALMLEEALAQVLPPERDKSSPRVSGAFIFDSMTHEMLLPEVARLALWCPANIPEEDLEAIPNTSQRSCPIQPDVPSLKLGPFSFASLPILPSRAQYLRFIAKYSPDDAGEMRSLEFRAPVRTPISEDVLLGEFGVATFFNNEVLTAALTDAFSYCSSGEELAMLVVFRAAGLPEPLPLSMLPDVQQEAPQGSYQLGLAWDFPFLLRLRYEVALAGTATAFSATIPFGLASSAEAYYGTEVWSSPEFPLAETLLLCTRFCDHPTFDSAGVYNVRATFRYAYGHSCYRPHFPAPGDGGFPRDP